MTDPTEPTIPDAPETHHHAATPPPRRGWKIAAIILAIIVGIAVVVGLTLFFVNQNTAPTPTPTPTATPTETPTPTPTPTETPVASCDTDNSTAKLGDSNAAAGSVQVPIIFTNTSSAPCTLEGFPVVEFVGDDNGTELGAPATEDTATSPVSLVTIEAGNSAESILTITIADVDGCTRVPADGFRVTPPGSTDSFYLPTTDYEACSEPDTSILKVSAVATN